MGAEGASFLEGRFHELADACSQFSSEVRRLVVTSPAVTAEESRRLNLRVARTMFGKWSIEILSLLSDGGMMGFQEMRKELGVSSKVLSAKLDQMQEVGIVHRRVMSTKPPRVLYGLEEKGKRVVNLGEPVFLYLRYTEGLRASEVPRLLPKQSREVRPGQR